MQVKGARHSGRWKETLHDARPLDLGVSHIAAENSNNPFYCLRSSWCSHERACPVLLAKTTLETRGVRRSSKGLKKMAALPVAESSWTREFPGYSTWQRARGMRGMRLGEASASGVGRIAHLVKDQRCHGVSDGVADQTGSGRCSADERDVCSF